MIRSLSIAVACCTAVSGIAPAQGAGSAAGTYRQATAVFERFLFPPELLMQHQRELELTEPQRVAITDEIKALEAQIVDFQWRLQDEQQQVAELLNQPTVSEEATLAAIGRLLDLERQVKITHFRALLRIRNALTPAQRERLETMRRHSQMRAR